MKKKLSLLTAWIVYSLPVMFLTGCATLNPVSTSPTTGHKKVFGIKIPFTGSGGGGEEVIIQDDKLLILVEQLEKFTWVGMVLVIAGAIWWKVTNGFTGLGKTLFGVGWAFIALALLLPQIVAYLVLFTIIILSFAMLYVLWVFVITKSFPTVFVPTRKRKTRKTKKKN